jgi:hypothetical protein
MDLKLPISSKLFEEADFLLTSQRRTNAKFYPALSNEVV